jgi:ATP-dependent Lon protease
MRVRRETVEGPFATLKMRLGATHFLMKTRSFDVDESGLTDVYDVGVLGTVLTLDQLADGRWKALIQIHRRVIIKDFVGEADGSDVEVPDEQPALDVPFLIPATKARFIVHSFRDTIKQGWDTIKQGYPCVPQIKAAVRTGPRSWPARRYDCIAYRAFDPG